MFKSSLILFLVIAAGLSSNAFAAVAVENRDGDSISNAYVQLVQAEHQLLISELALEVQKSASFENLLTNGHASWLENRQQKLVTDILKAKLAAYEQFESRAKDMLTDGKIMLEARDNDLIDTRSETIQDLQTELSTLRQSEQKMANGITTLPANDSWAEGYRLRHALKSNQAKVIAARIVLLEYLNAEQSEIIERSEFISAGDKGTTSTAAWTRPAEDSNLMQLLITQAGLQIQLSQHHLSNETRRLSGMQELANGGMTTKSSVTELKSKVDAIQELLKEQQDNLSWLKKELEAAPEVGDIYTSLEAQPVSNKAVVNELTVLPTLLNQFELGKANYLRDEAILKGEMYREVLAKLEQAVAVQAQPTNFGGTSTDFSDVLLRGQQRELEQYRWKIKKTQLQRDLADAQIELLKELDGSQPDNVNVLVSTGTKFKTPITLPSRFISGDPFGLQTTYSSFVYNSPRYKAHRPVLSTRGDFSSVFRPIINRNALSYYSGHRSSRFGSSFGRFSNQVHSFGLLNAGPRTFRPPGQSPFFFPGSPQTFNFNRFNSSTRFNSYRSNAIYHSSGPGYYGR